MSSFGRPTPSEAFVRVLCACLCKRCKGPFAHEVIQPAPTQETSDSALVEALTPREREVLELLAEGLSNKDIGRALGISEHTAKFHVNALLGKLDAQTRTEAVVRALRLGLLHL